MNDLRLRKLCEISELTLGPCAWTLGREWQVNRVTGLPQPESGLPFFFADIAQLSRFPLAAAGRAGLVSPSQVMDAGFESRLLAPNSDWRKEWQGEEFLRQRRPSEKLPKKKPAPAIMGRGDTYIRGPTGLRVLINTRSGRRGASNGARARSLAAMPDAEIGEKNGKEKNSFRNGYSKGDCES